MKLLILGMVGYERLLLGGAAMKNVTGYHPYTQTASELFGRVT